MFTDMIGIKSFSAVCSTKERVSFAIGSKNFSKDFVYIVFPNINGNSK